MVCAACAEHEQASRTASRSELEQSHEFRQIVYLQASYAAGRGSCSPMTAGSITGSVAGTLLLAAGEL